jgi:hypothetical protein
MLENLDSIDWSKLHHSYGSAETTPKYIRMLASADTDDRKRAYDHLYGSVNHQGDVLSATSAVVPFIIELLSIEAIPDRSRLIEYLASLVESCNDHLPNGYRDSNIGYLRHDIDTYNNVCQGLDLYISLLQSDDPEIRINAAQLLGMLVDQVARIKEPLWEAIQGETDPNTLAIMIMNFGLLFRRYWPFGENPIQPYLDYFLTLMETHPSEPIRLCAARAIIDSNEIRYRLRGTPIYEAVVSTLLDALNNPESYLLYPYIYRGEVLNYLNRLEIETLHTLLDRETISPHAAHWVAREMLNRVFINRWRNHFFSWGSFEHPSRNTGQYAWEGYPRLFEATRSLFPNQQKVLQSILECKPFWQIPTNLFSYFYGLPDDPVQLAELAKTK